MGLMGLMASTPRGSLGGNVSMESNSPGEAICAHREIDPDFINPINPINPTSPELSAPHEFKSGVDGQSSKPASTPSTPRNTGETELSDPVASLLAACRALGVTLKLTSDLRRLHADGEPDALALVASGIRENLNQLKRVLLFSGQVFGLRASTRNPADPASREHEKPPAVVAEKTPAAHPVQRRRTPEETAAAWSAAGGVLPFCWCAEIDPATARQFRISPPERNPPDANSTPGASDPAEGPSLPLPADDRDSGPPGRWRGTDSDAGQPGLWN